MLAIDTITGVKIDVALFISISSSCRVAASIVGIVAGGPNRSGLQLVNRNKFLHVLPYFAVFKYDTFVV
jgi:hypothetical protein